MIDSAYRKLDHIFKLFNIYLKKGKFDLIEKMFRVLGWKVEQIGDTEYELFYGSKKLLEVEISDSSIKVKPSVYLSGYSVSFCSFKDGLNFNQQVFLALPLLGFRSDLFSDHTSRYRTLLGLSLFDKVLTWGDGVYNCGWIIDYDKICKEPGKLFCFYMEGDVIYYHKVVPIKSNSFLEIGFVVDEFNTKVREISEYVKNLVYKKVSEYKDATTKLIFLPPGGKKGLYYCRGVGSEMSYLIELPKGTGYELIERIESRCRMDKIELMELLLREEKLNYISIQSGNLDNGRLALIDLLRFDVKRLDPKKKVVFLESEGNKLEVPLSGEKPIILKNKQGKQVFDDYLDVLLWWKKR